MVKWNANAKMALKVQDVGETSQPILASQCLVWMKLYAFQGMVMIIDVSVDQDSKERIVKEIRVNQSHVQTMVHAGKVPTPSHAPVRTVSKASHAKFQIPAFLILAWMRENALAMESPFHVTAQKVTEEIAAKLKIILVYLVRVKIMLNVSIKEKPSFANAKVDLLVISVKRKCTHVIKILVETTATAKKFKIAKMSLNVSVHQVLWESVVRRIKDLVLLVNLVRTKENASMRESITVVFVSRDFSERIVKKTRDLVHLGIPVWMMQNVCTKAMTFYANVLWHLKAKNVRMMKGPVLSRNHVWITELAKILEKSTNVFAH
jgi:hypothetical protein